MKRILLCTICSLLAIASFAQVVRLGEEFTEVPVIEGKIVFLKEIPAPAGNLKEANYRLLTDWAGINYGKEPFVSSIRYDKKNHEFIAKSRIELILPENSKGVREKMIMRYRINGFLVQDKCVLEITDISFLYENSSKDNILPRVIRAEDFITDKAIAMQDHIQELRKNTRISTLFFLNQISASFEKQFGY